MPIVVNAPASSELGRALACLEKVPTNISEINRRLEAILVDSDARQAEQQLRELAQIIPETIDVPQFVEARGHLASAMAEVGHVISGMWDSDRYVRAAFEED